MSPTRSRGESLGSSRGRTMASGRFSAGARSFSARPSLINNDVYEATPLESNRLQEGVALAPGAQLDDAVAGEVGERDELRLAGEHRIVDAAAAAFDQPARLAVRGGKAGAGEGLEGRQPFLQHFPLQLDDGHFAAHAAL